MNELIRKRRKTIELGRAIEIAVGMHLGTTLTDRLPITKVLIDSLIADLSDMPLDDAKASWWYQIGSRNPKPLMEELIRWMNALGRHSEPAGPYAEHMELWFQMLNRPDYPTCYQKCRDLVYDLNKFFINVPRFTSPGRPKGKTRPKVTPDVKEAVQKWLKARNKKSRCSVASLARKQKVSRATIYRVIEELR